MGRVDVLFNNAGISPDDDASVLETSLEAWQRVQDVNLKAVFLCCKHGIPHLLFAGGGSVINTASFVAVMGAATSQISYTASKGGVLALSRELGVEFARRGVRVNALCPGPVNTPLLQELFAKDPEQAERRLVHVPMGRFAETREIAQAALFLASDDSLLRHRLDLPRRRRHLGRLRHPGVGDSRGDPAGAQHLVEPAERPISASRKRPQRLRPNWFQPAIFSRVSARRASGSRPIRTASSSSRHSSIHFSASAAVTSAWNWIPQARSPIR